MKKILPIALLFLFTSWVAWASGEEGEPEKTHESGTGFWVGLYTKYKVSKRVFYYGEYHIRRRNEFIQNMAQIYLRFGATYLVSPSIALTGGIATPLYWAPDQDDPDVDPVVPQFRFWEQVLLVQHIDRSKFYHQYRLEQRWERDFPKGSEFHLDFRFRYKLAWYYPLNNTHFVKGTNFLSPYAEVFFQAGERITYNFFEDVRIFLGAGRVINEFLQIQAGYMYTYRHRGSPYNYQHRHIIRVSFFHSLDFYKRKQDKQRQEAIILRDEF